MHLAHIDIVQCAGDIGLVQRQQRLADARRVVAIGRGGWRVAKVGRHRSGDLCRAGGGVDTKGAHHDMSETDIPPTAGGADGDRGLAETGGDRVEGVIACDVAIAAGIVRQARCAQVAPGGIDMIENEVHAGGHGDVVAIHRQRWPAWFALGAGIREVRNLPIGASRFPCQRRHVQLDIDSQGSASRGKMGGGGHGLDGGCVRGAEGKHSSEESCRAKR